MTVRTFLAGGASVLVAAAMLVAPTATAAPLTIGTVQSAVDRGSAETVARKMADRIPTAVKVTKATQANDSNHLLGRPGGYTSAAWISDGRLDEPDLGVDTGAVVEVFQNDTAAKARVTYIHTIQNGLGFGHFYMTRIGNVVLRVSGDFTPGQYKTYRSAFTAVLG